MRVSSILLLLLCAAPLAAQEEKGKIPRKGDTLVIRGCLRGSALESAQATRVNAEGDPVEGDPIPTFTYRLEGEKRLLKDMKDGYDRKVVEVRGILKSDLSGSALGTTVGRTRINIGVDPGSTRGAQAPVPVLEARSFEGTTVACGK